jgi:hypothetical protein
MNLSWYTVLWDVAPCSLVENYRCFGGAYYLHHQGMSATGPSMPGNSNLQTHCRENMKSSRRIRMMSSAEPLPNTRNWKLAAFKFKCFFVINVTTKGINLRIVSFLPSGRIEHKLLSNATTTFHYSPFPSLQTTAALLAYFPKVKAGLGFILFC